MLIHLNSTGSDIRSCPSLSYFDFFESFLKSDYFLEYLNSDISQDRTMCCKKSRSTK